MGYATTNIVMYGVTLNKKQTRELQSYLEKTYQKDFSEYDVFFMEFIPEEDLVLHGNRLLYCMEVRSHGTDSRIHSNYFDLDKETDHTFGIYCASNGYAWHDKLESVTKDVPQKAKDNFEKYCQPILKTLGIDVEPGVVLVTQIW